MIWRQMLCEMNGDKCCPQKRQPPPDERPGVADCAVAGQKPHQRHPRHGQLPGEARGRRRGGGQVGGGES